MKNITQFENFDNESTLKESGIYGNGPTPVEVAAKKYFQTLRLGGIQFLWTINFCLILLPHNVLNLFFLVWWSVKHKKIDWSVKKLKNKNIKNPGPKDLDFLWAYS